MKKILVPLALLVGVAGVFMGVRMFVVQHEMKVRVARVQTSMEQWMEDGQNPAEAYALMQQAPEAFKNGDLKKAAQLIAQAQAILDMPVDKRPLAPGIEGEEPSDLYGNPVPVEIAGYAGQAMEPFISPDGRFLFFNNENDPEVNTDLHVAERAGTNSFRYLGPLGGVNSPKLDAVASMDADHHFYFTTVRDYERTFKSIYTGVFDGKGVKGVHPVPGPFNPDRLGTINMDVGISPDGKTMYISRAVFIPGGRPAAGPSTSDLVVARLENSGFSIDPASRDTMKNVNSDALEYAPAISANGRELYFTRAATVNAAAVNPQFRIMVATRNSVEEPFGRPKVLSALRGAVEAPSVSLDLGELFFHKKVKGKWTIWRAVRKGSDRK